MLAIAPVEPRLSGSLPSANQKDGPGGCSAIMMDPLNTVFGEHEQREKAGLPAMTQMPQGSAEMVGRKSVSRHA